MGTKTFFRIHDVKFDIIPIKHFTDAYICDKPKVEGGHSLKIACKNKKTGNIEYFLKIMSIPTNYKYFDFVLALNEVMSSLLYNKVFKLYSPILHLVYSKESSGYKGTNYLVATKYEDINKYSKHNHDFIDYKKGIIIDSIMANWDIAIAGNYYQIDKNNGNTNTTNKSKFLRLDVGGCLLLRAQGEDKIPFISAEDPNEISKSNPFGWLKSAALAKEITPENIKISFDYLCELYKNNLFNNLDSLRYHMLDIINKTILNVDELLNKKYNRLAHKLINFNIIQIKRRILWYLNQYNPSITFTGLSLNKIHKYFKMPKKNKYIYPVNTNIINNEMPCQWTPKKLYPLPNEVSRNLLDQINKKLTTKEKNSVRIMTYNIGAIAKTDEPNLINFINKNNVDIACYQEKIVNYNNVHHTNKNSKHQLECNPTRTGLYGANTINFNKTKLETSVNILTQLTNTNNNGFELMDSNKKKYASAGKCVNILELEFKKSKHKLIIYNLHLDVARNDNGRDWRIKSLKLILSKYKKVKSKYPNAIILGDFNTYNRSEYNLSQLQKLHSEKGEFATDNFKEMGIANIDNITNIKGENPLFSDKEYNKKIPIDVLKYAGWVDAFEINGLPAPVNTSHWSGKTDFIFLSPEWNLKINGLYTHYSTLSDHLPLFIDIDIVNVNELKKPQLINMLYHAILQLNRKAKRTAKSNSRIGQTQTDKIMPKKYKKTKKAKTQIISQTAFNKQNTIDRRNDFKKLATPK